MNPFTKYLNQWSTDNDFDLFVDYWDRLERVVVGVYREKMDLAAAAPEYAKVWPWLRDYYPKWKETLLPFWQATQAAGAPTQTDPFRLLLDVDDPSAISGEWRLMQHLPAAREAINKYLVDQGRD